LFDFGGVFGNGGYYMDPSFFARLRGGFQMRTLRKKFSKFSTVHMEPSISISLPALNFHHSGEETKRLS
jgi:hypothetical protein